MFTTDVARYKWRATLGHSVLLAILFGSDGASDYEGQQRHTAQSPTLLSSASRLNPPPMSIGLIPAQTQTAKIMPLGDSITESVSGQSSYRYFLWHLAAAKGYRIDFVGSKYGVVTGQPATDDFDLDHEGHSGWRADQIRSKLNGWATATAPDFVLIHLGHNDVCQSRSVESIVADLSGIIDIFRAVNPHVGILLGQVIATPQCPVGILNEQLPALVTTKATTVSPVILVDQHTGFDPLRMTWDGMHPNAEGESRMADRWFEKLAPMLNAFSRAQ